MPADSVFLSPVSVFTQWQCLLRNASEEKIGVEAFSLHNRSSESVQLAKSHGGYSHGRQSKTSAVNDSGSGGKIYINSTIRSSALLPSAFSSPLLDHFFSFFYYPFNTSPLAALNAASPLPSYKPASQYLLHNRAPGI